MSHADRHPSFLVKGLDCAEEISALRREVGPVVGGEELLSFDLLHARMTVGRSLGGDELGALHVAVRRAGLEARPWVEAGGTRPREGFWERHGHLLTCAGSGLAIALALAWQIVERRGLDAVLGSAAGLTPSLPVLLLYLLAVLSGGWFVLPKALAAARARRPDMNLLMSVAVAGAMAIGQWFEAATVAFLFSLALNLERWSVGRARRAIGALLDLAPQVARVVDPGGTVGERGVGEVAVGETVRVRAGEKIPLDGEVLSGRSAVDQSAITGESMPVERGPGDAVYAGTLNGSGVLELRVTRVAGETTLARIIRLVDEARAQRAPVERWVERFARRYTPAMMGLALAVAVLPPLIGGSWGYWLYQALVLLVIACPCALVISTPVAIVAGLAAAARAGVLIKGGSFLELPAGFKVVAFDKTGTLTYGRPTVQRLVPLDGHDETELLARAAALEAESTHPLAAAILAEARERRIEFSAADELTQVAGKGAEGTLGGRRFWIGSHRLLTEKRAESAAAARLADELQDAGHSLVALGNDDHVCGLIGVADELRPGARRVVAELRRAGVERVVMITGDNEPTARAVACALGLDEYRSELLPAGKVAEIGRLAGEHGSVAMVGDGVNDAPALAAATAGIAMGAAGTDAAIETADIALMADDLDRLPWLIRHSRRTLRVIRQNIGFALAVKAAFVLLAALGLATLWLAIAADMGASLLVIANALRLLRDARPA